MATLAVARVEDRPMTQAILGMVRDGTPIEAMMGDASVLIAYDGGYFAVTRADWYELEKLIAAEGKRLDEGGSCEYCGEQDATTTIDLSDPSTGYTEHASVCAECARGNRRAA